MEAQGLRPISTRPVGPTPSSSSPSSKYVRYVPLDGTSAPRRFLWTDRVASSGTLAFDQAGAGHFVYGNQADWGLVYLTGHFSSDLQPITEAQW